jgi:hypothetical protein
MSDLRQRAEEFFQRRLRIRQRYGRDCDRAEHQFKEVVPEPFIPHELPGGLVESVPGPNYQAALDRALEDRNHRLKALEEEFSEVVNDPMFIKMDNEFRKGRLKSFFEGMAKQEPAAPRTPDPADWWKGNEPAGVEDPADWWKKAWVLKNCRFAQTNKLWDDRYQGYGDIAPGGDYADFEAATERFQKMQQEWFEHNKQLAGNASVVELSTPDGSRKCYVHQTSNSGSSKWQLSYMDGTIPTGHDIFNKYQGHVDRLGSPKLPVRPQRVR